MSASSRFSRDSEHRAGPGRRARLVARKRRRRILDGFTRFMASKPMFTAPYGVARNPYTPAGERDEAQLVKAGEWRETHAKWARYFDKRRNNDVTVRLR